MRFGYRDYDPRFGRFTAKDPACDLRGDGDLWDYCLDDPVGKFDPTGLWTQERYNVQRISHTQFEPELTFAQALSSGKQNFKQSGKNFVKDLAYAVEHGDQTIEGIGKIIGGYGSQLLGLDNDLRAYSDRVTDYFSERYGSYANFKKTLAADPVGLAADVSMVFTGGAGAVRGLAKVGTMASKFSKAGTIGRGLHSASTMLDNAGSMAGKLGTIADPLYLPGKIIGKTAQMSVAHMPKNIRALARRGPKLATLGARSKAMLGVAATTESVERSTEK